ncbi:tyrosine-type recombinase/integrase [Cytobacillus sp. FSL W7-1323]|uniref:Site-specific integrase n=1 Tax=Cytobacillus kochii TaxID=859143 RepID=A0A248TKV3_9BACI|nr:MULTISPECIES: tyrosine-type recombinase/integrase [Cytobacillus]ASV68858.1 site-specific integrase [Cytobacillus kochii]MCA1025331.1 tyrosine-type recombinase/integrase [Cytobacillus kochii]MCM3323239.1 tyrosine-type recombinase/integrase [Cytobacillus kochii]MCM3345634.1 tyrosine-type recombinase/integrase [Cytobacillus kochii]MDM5208624.1 tyrosine-type recombinase/integrase [Cytobacillus kochii]
MEFVDPIKDIEDINKIKSELRLHSQRDVLLFVLGINTGIRVSDLLFLKVKDLWEEEGLKEFLYIKDEKNGDSRAFYLNNSILKELASYMKLFKLNDNDYLFKSKKNKQPITRQQAYRIINQAAKKVGVQGKIGTHTLRKTFGYHAYRKGIAISILMNIYNHNTPAETLRYIGIDKFDKKLIKVDVNL